MRIPVAQYYMSDHAYNGLVHLAQKYGYIDFGVRRAKGISKFIMAIARTKLNDTRPDNIKRRHQEEMSYNRAPTWMGIHRQRRARALMLDDYTIQRLVLVAHEFSIIKDEPYAIGGPSRQTPYPTVAFVLEGIGLQWLTPDIVPINEPKDTDTEESEYELHV